MSKPRNSDLWGICWELVSDDLVKFCDLSIVRLVYLIQFLRLLSLASVFRFWPVLRLPGWRSFIHLDFSRLSRRMLNQICLRVTLAHHLNLFFCQIQKEFLQNANQKRHSLFGICEINVDIFFLVSILDTIEARDCMLLKLWRSRVRRNQAMLHQMSSKLFLLHGVYFGCQCCLLSLLPIRHNRGGRADEGHLVLSAWIFYLLNFCWHFYIFLLK